ncbi:Deleted in lung and esophageal cancer protein 1 [Acipenser ruthenus]|uniref:Deleted in lung and esophageal cancer protein 1 n=1 Tax=Acipenser ruthenus TaxID=7906 RepID=A0A662YTJ9_ACIRT|nr:Deleted in lung and esophageal cancer protein 1 [Acipenser ruthenus]
MVLKVYFLHIRIQFKERTPSFQFQQAGQDISHLFASIFKDLYTTDVIGKDTVANLEKSCRRGNSYHDKYVGELQKVLSEYSRRIAEADMLEQHIIQARARATALEERALNRAIEEVGDVYHRLGLPSVEWPFRWCVDNKLLQKHNLICPEDYIKEQPLLTTAPRGKSAAGFTNLTLSFQKHVCTVLPPPEESAERLLEGSELSLTLPPSPEHIERTTKSSSQKQSVAKKPAWKDEMSESDRVQERADLANLDKRHNFIKNPRFQPPHIQRGGKSLIVPPRKVERMVAGRRVVVEERDPYEPIPVFLANPPVVFFTNYRVGQIYETSVELRNLTSSSRPLRVIPPSTPHFSIGLGKFPGEGGLVAPGMSCLYTIRFAPDSQADYEDFILVETQTPYPLLVPIEARCPPPILTLPSVLDCGYCLVSGVKVVEFLCRNEGLSAGRFCIMPKSVWPATNFRPVASAGFVEQLPFVIRPNVFELHPGQATAIEVLFLPSSSDVFKQTFTIVCDNCQVKDIAVTGTGQLIALQLTSVTGGEDIPIPGELTDLTAEHFIRFGALNPHSGEQKKVVIRNATHLELPFHWQIMKPNLKPLMPGEAIEPDRIEYNLATDKAFNMSPGQGILAPHHDHDFILSYCPHELKDYHSVCHLVLRDIPEPKKSAASGTEKQVKSSARAGGQAAVNDVIVMEIEVKGSTQPLKVLLEPYAIFIPGENFIGTTIKKRFKMWNNSIAHITFDWERISDCHILEVEPLTGVIEPNECCDLELALTGGKPGSSTLSLLCHIEHHPEPVTLHVEAAFKGPQVCIDLPSLDLGLMKLGDSALSTIQLNNISQLAASWSLQECPSEQPEVSQFVIDPCSGMLPPLGSCSVSVLFTPSKCQHFQTVLQLSVENGAGCHLAVQADIQKPRVCLQTCELVFQEMYVGVPVWGTVNLLNQTMLPAKFSWGELIGKQASQCSATVFPSSGIVGPKETEQMSVEFTAHTESELTDTALLCSVTSMEEPLVLEIFAKASGLHVTFSVPSDSPEQEWQDPSKLLLDFGAQLLNSKVKQQLIITNHTAIPAPFSVEAEYFCGRLPSPPADSARNSRAALRFGTHISGGDTVSRSLRINNPSPYTIRMDWETLNQEKGDSKLVDLLVSYGDAFPLKDADGNEVIGGRVGSCESRKQKWDWDTLPSTAGTSSSMRTDHEEEEEEGEEGEQGELEEVNKAQLKKIISVNLQAHEGTISDYPYCITPRQILVPAGGSATLHVSFTPLTLSEIVSETECAGFALGFLSLDSKVAGCIPGKVERAQGYELEPLRLDLHAFVKPALLTLELEDEEEEEEGVVFYASASDLIPRDPHTKILLESVTTRRLRLLNNTETPLYFRLLAPEPFSVLHVEPRASMETSHSEREEEGGLVLHPQHNMQNQDKNSISLQQQRLLIATGARLLIATAEVSHCNSRGFSLQQEPGFSLQQQRFLIATAEASHCNRSQASHCNSRGFSLQQQRLLIATGARLLIATAEVSHCNSRGFSLQQEPGFSLQQQRFLIATAEASHCNRSQASHCNSRGFSLQQQRLLIATGARLLIATAEVSHCNSRGFSLQQEPGFSLQQQRFLIATAEASHCNRSQASHCNSRGFSLQQQRLLIATGARLLIATAEVSHCNSRGFSLQQEPGFSLQQQRFLIATAEASHCNRSQASHCNSRGFSLQQQRLLIATGARLLIATAEVSHCNSRGFSLQQEPGFSLQQQRFLIATAEASHCNRSQASHCNSRGFSLQQQRLLIATGARLLIATAEVSHCNSRGFSLQQEPGFSLQQQRFLIATAEASHCNRSQASHCNSRGFSLQQQRLLIATGARLLIATAEVSHCNSRGFSLQQEPGFSLQQQRFLIATAEASHCNRSQASHCNSRGFSLQQQRLLIATGARLLIATAEVSHCNSRGFSLQQEPGFSLQQQRFLIATAEASHCNRSQASHCNSRGFSLQQQRLLIATGARLLIATAEVSHCNSRGFSLQQEPGFSLQQQRFLIATAEASHCNRSQASHCNSRGFSLQQQRLLIATGARLLIATAEVSHCNSRGFSLQQEPGFSLQQQRFLIATAEASHCNRSQASHCNSRGFSLQQQRLLIATGARLLIATAEVSHCNSRGFSLQQEPGFSLQQQRFLIATAEASHCNRSQASHCNSRGFSLQQQRLLIATGARLLIATAEVSHCNSRGFSLQQEPGFSLQQQRFLIATAEASHCNRSQASHCNSRGFSLQQQRLLIATGARLLIATAEVSHCNSRGFSLQQEPGFSLQQQRLLIATGARLLIATAEVSHCNSRGFSLQQEPGFSLQQELGFSLQQEPGSSL